MSCPDGDTRHRCAASGGSGIPSPLEVDRWTYLEAVRKATRYRHRRGTQARRAEELEVEEAALSAYAQAVCQAVFDGQIDFEAAVQLGCEADIRRYLARRFLDQDFIAALPLQRDGRWLRRTEFLSAFAGLYPLSGRLYPPDAKALQQALERAYDERVSRAISLGDLDFATGLTLIGESKARMAMIHRYQRLAATLPLDAFVQAITVYWRDVFLHQLQSFHERRVTEELKNGAVLPEAILRDYPFIAARACPWRLTPDAYVRMVRERRLAQPLKVRTLRNFTDPDGRSRNTTPDPLVAEKVMEEARRYLPRLDWRIERSLGEPPLYQVVGWELEDDGLDDETRDRLLHRKAVEQPLAGDLPVPEDVLLCYPDLLLQHGLS